MRISRSTKIITFAVFLFFATQVHADSVGDVRTFFVDKNYDADDRRNVSALLVRSSLRADIYADLSWWNFISQSDAEATIDNLAREFDSTIYPALTTTFGEEWSPGIDRDSKITILIQLMKGDAGGYFRTNDEYSKILITDSNEREMIYINAKNISDRNLNAFVAHEFIHVITFHQKNKRFSLEEDTWLNEARAEYATTFLGYNANYEGSYLAKRAQQFSDEPSGSLIDWHDTKYDYARAALFVHYLVDHYGVNILVDSLQSSKIGIESIDYALQKNGFKERFFDVFSDWAVASLINNCNVGAEYCYLNKNLKNFYLSPVINFLPLSGSTTLTFSDSIKYCSGNWYKIIGGSGGTLRFNFEGNPSDLFKISHVKKNKLGNYILGSMELNGEQKGELSIESFGRDVTALFIIPILQSSGGTPDNNLHNFSWSTSISHTTESVDMEEIQRLQAIIEDLKQKIATILSSRQNGGQNVSPNLCRISTDLYFGLSDNNDVRCLQEFLKNQGPEIYPEGLVTGNFASLTLRAVTRFQEKYALEILHPLGLSYATGYVGVGTRSKINQLSTGL